MPVFKRRTRIVSFRVSEDEYQELLGVCMAQGAHSVSDFARLATRQCISEGNRHGQGVIQAWIRQLSSQVSQLDSEVRRLAQLIRQA